VVIADVNLDGWLDVITCTTLGDGLPHAIKDPRVYINKGSIAGVWQGLKYETARIPSFTPAPHFCGVAAGDVDGDGAPDLYFADYGNLSDKLLINDGNGFFTDSGTQFIAASMLDSAFGDACNIIDMTGDGRNDRRRGRRFRRPSQDGDGNAHVGWNDDWQRRIRQGTNHHRSRIDDCFERRDHQHGHGSDYWGRNQHHLYGRQLCRQYLYHSHLGCLSGPKRYSHPQWRRRHLHWYLGH